jgi:hypothetical protein
MAKNTISHAYPIRNHCRLPVPPGTVFGMLTIIREAESKKRAGAGWKRKFLTRCSCGNERIAFLEKLRNGMVHSCGCANIKSMLRHGMSHTPTHKVWAAMKARCTNPTCRAFPGWGGRGIKIDKTWATFENFFADMGEKPPGRSLERIDNNGDYTKKNCRWATPGEQSRNTRRTLMVVLGGVQICVKDAAAHVGISGGMIKYRAKLMNGTLQDALDYYAARRHS